MNATTKIKQNPYLHSAIAYKTPNEFEKVWFKNNQMTPSQTS